MNPILQNLNSTSNNQNDLFDTMMQTNKQFRDFMEQNKGKTPFEIAQAYGIDINQLIKLASYKK